MNCKPEVYVSADFVHYYDIHQIVLDPPSVKIFFSQNHFFFIQIACELRKTLTDYCELSLALLGYSELSQVDLN